MFDADEETTEIMNNLQDAECLGECDEHGNEVDLVLVSVSMICPDCLSEALYGWLCDLKDKLTQSEPADDRPACLAELDRPEPHGPSERSKAGESCNDEVHGHIGFHPLLEKCLLCPYELRCIEALDQKQL
jgi:hypothetical protein